MEEQKPQIIEETRCLFGDIHNGIPHTCPFKVEVNDNDTDLCQCCEECTHECADEV